MVVLVEVLDEGDVDELDELCAWLPDELCCDWPCGDCCCCPVDDEEVVSSALDAATGINKNTPDKRAARATSLGMLLRQSSLLNFGDIYTLK